MKAMPLADVDISKDLTELARQFDKLLKSHKRNLAFQVVMCPIDFSDLLHKKAEKSEYLSVVREESETSLFRLKKERWIRYIGKQIEFQEDFLVKRTSKGGVYLAIAFANSEIWSNLILWYLERLKPQIAFPYYNQNEFREIITNLKANNGVEVFVASRTYRPKESQRKLHKTYKARREWEEEGISLDYVFEGAIEEGERITKINFKVVENSETIGDYSMATQKDFICKKGCSHFVNTALPKAITLASKKFRLLTGRSRETTPDHRAKPIEIRYKIPVFPDVSANVDFIDKLRLLPNFSCTVLHGNPYIHLSLADYSDGSSYQVLVLSKDKITIVPQIISEGSLSKLITYIFEKFREGEVIGEDIGSPVA